MAQPHLRPVDRFRSNSRVVERHRSTGLGVVWAPPTKGLLGVRPRRTDAHLIDLSVAGLLVVAPANPKAPPGTLAELWLDGARGVVRVRHATPAAPAADGPRAHYGLQFVELEPALKERVYRLVEADREDADRLAMAWRTAR